MGTVTFKSKPVHTNGEPLIVGKTAPTFALVGQDLAEVTLETLGKKKKLLNIFPSMDTSVCSLALRKFYEKTQNIPDLVVLNISMDLPFAAARFTKENKLDKAVTLSAFRSDFPDKYGVRLTDGPLKGLCARTVIVLDQDNKVVYSELVPEITSEPNYDAALKKISGKD
jgi:thiol peroxidase